MQENEKQVQNKRDCKNTREIIKSEKMCIYNFKGPKKRGQKLSPAGPSSGLPGLN